MIETHMSCDCGCGRLNDGFGEWFVLDNVVSRRADVMRLQRPHHFASLECLESFVQVARTVKPGLVKAANVAGAKPGFIHHPDIPTIGIP